MFSVHYAGFQLSLIVSSCVFVVVFRRCGPPSRYWCMRFEVKNGYFKDLTHQKKNLKKYP